MPDHGITPDMVPTSSAITGDQIDAVVETVRRICGWHIWPVREETVKLDSSGDCLLSFLLNGSWSSRASRLVASLLAWTRCNGRKMATCKAISPKGYGTSP